MKNQSLMLFYREQYLEMLASNIQMKYWQRFLKQWNPMQHFTSMTPKV